MWTNGMPFHFVPMPSGEGDTGYFALPAYIEGLWKHPAVQAMRGCEQDLERHPEGDVWEHTNLVYNYLEDCFFMNTKRKYIMLIAAVLHDVGKPVVRKEIDGRLTFHEHHIVGAKMASNILSDIPAGNECIIKDVVWLVRNHMTPQLEDVSDRKLRKLSKHKFWGCLVMLSTADAYSCGAVEAIDRIAANNKTIVGNK